jgi:5-methylcytosine-specific restriction endonuclease McrA
MTSHSSTLILNHYMVPHRVASWQDAITELFTGKVEILEWYDEIVYQNADRGITMKMPAVARLLKPVASHKKGVKFSRVNVMARDNFICQYCGTKYTMHDLNYDHVVPRVQGGKTVWENIVTSCYDCNDKKGARTPEQAKMKLIRKPFRPKTLPLAQPVLAMRNIPPEWEPFTGSVTA